MCTCVNFLKNDFYFGRNLDLDYRFGEKVVITPRNYTFSLKNGKEIRTSFAMIGMAAVSGGYPLYAEASNEKGLSMAGLYFPESACFFDEKNSKLNLAPYELIPYFLGQYSSVSQVKKLLPTLNITNIPFEKSMPVTDLHWMLSDEKESLVIEQTKDGLNVFENPVGVLTNNPPFDYHMTNLNNYINLSPNYSSENRFSSGISLKPYGMGMGAIGLPGDNSPASRFVRAAFNKFNSDCEDDEESCVTRFFHILDSVSFIKGTVLSKAGRPDYTVYSCCINASKGIYYYKTYTNNQITAITMTQDEKDKSSLSVFELEEKQQIRNLYTNI